MTAQVAVFLYLMLVTQASKGSDTVSALQSSQCLIFVKTIVQRCWLQSSVTVEATVFCLCIKFMCPCSWASSCKYHPHSLSSFCLTNIAMISITVFITVLYQMSLCVFFTLSWLKLLWERPQLYEKKITQHYGILVKLPLLIFNCYTVVLSITSMYSMFVLRHRLDGCHPEGGAREA